VDGTTGAADRDLIARIARGDRDAFTTFARRWERPLFSFLLRLTGSRTTAEEARQATLVSVYRRAVTFRGGTPSTWVFRIAHRAAVDALRRESRAHETGARGAMQIRDRAPPPSAMAESSERAAFVRSALARLDPEERAVVWLRVAEDLSFAQVAEVTGESPSTVRYRFLRSLRRLRQHLGTPVDCGLDA
jgi:RNA polymerase sigma-70 factor (ECF subfamily)